MPDVRGAVPLMLALLYWRRHWSRAVVMLLGLLVGLSLLVGVLLVNDSLARTYAGWARGNAGWSELEVRATSDAGLRADLLDQVRAQPGVGAVAPLLESSSYLLTAEARLSVSVKGVDPEAEAAIRPFSIVAGRGLEPGDSQVTLLSYAAAVALDAGPGSDVSLITPAGVETLRVVGVYHPAGDDSLVERVAQLPLAQAQALFAQGRNALSRIDVATTGGALAPVEESLRSLVGGDATLRRTAEGPVDLAGATRGLRTLLLLAGLLAVMAAGVLIVVYIRTMVAERSADLRVIRDLGVPAATVRRWLTLEVGLVVTLAAAPALMVAAPLAAAILARLPASLLPFAANVAAPRLGASALPLTLLGSAVAAGAAVAVLRLLLLRLLTFTARRLVGATGGPVWPRLAGHFLRLRLGQAATVATAIALTTAGVIGVHGAAAANRSALADWLDGAVKWDLMVAAGPAQSGTSVTLPHAAVAQLAAMPGVEAVSAERQVAVTSRGKTVTMIALDGFGLDMGNRLSVVHSADLSGSAMWLDLRQGQGVALSVPLASRLELTVGDRLPLSTPAGESEFTVVALVDDASSRAEAAYIALDNYAAMWGDSGVDSIVVRLSPGAEAVALAASVNGGNPQRPARLPLHVTLADSYRAELLAVADDTFMAARLMVLLALLIALVALLTSTMAAAWQAEPEMAGLRAMGAARPRLAGVLLCNLALTAAAGAVPGMLLGTLLSRQLGSAPLGTAGQWSWPVDAYASVAALLALTALLAAAYLVYSRRGFNLPRWPRR
ncbi:MAG: FtsX-like permease family protein [Trueperaceae bacterium]